MIIQTGWTGSTGMTGNAFNSTKSDHYFSMPIKEYINDKLSLDGYCGITSLTLTCTGWIECFWPGEFKMDIGYGGNGSISTYLLQGGSICGADNNAEKTFTVNLKDIISGKQVSYSKGSYITFRIYSSAVGTKSYAVEKVYLDVQCSNHSWTNATCTTPNKCSVCGVTEGSALGHSWVNATCTAPKTCTVCGATEGSALGHSWGTTTYTWSEDGKTCTATRVCSRCGTTETATETATSEVSIPAGCISWGSTKYTATFRVGWATTDYKYVQDISPTGHTPGEIVIEPGVEATCESNGYHYEVVYCTVCGALVRSTYKSIPAKGHSYTTQTFEPTETSPGYTRYTCSVCGHYYDVDITCLVKLVAENGTITGATNGRAYPQGTSLTLTATPNSGYKFVKWSDGVTTATRTVTVNVSTTYTAIFEKLPPEITSVQMLYLNKQVSANNKVPAGEYFRIVVAAAAHD